MLSQCDSSGQEHPVTYFSQKLLPCKEHYSTVEKECLAIKLGVQAFKVYLLGRPFKVLNIARQSALVRTWALVCFREKLVHLFYPLRPS